MNARLSTGYGATFSRKGRRGMVARLFRTQPEFDVGA